MKRILTLLSVLLIAIILTVPVFAADANVSISSESVYRGDQVIFTVTVAETISDIGAGGIILNYDTDVLEFVFGQWSVGNTLMALFQSSTEGAFMCNVGASTTVGGTLCTITFNVKDDAPISSTAFSAKVAIQNASGTNLTVVTTPGSVTVKCRHSFTAEKAIDDYLNDAAACTTKAVYYKSCSVCGEKGTETFESGNVLGHSWSSTYSQNTEGHYRTCTRTGCGVSEDPTACSGETKTCTERAICSTCLKPYGSTLPHNFDEGTWKSDASGHWKKCKDCTAEDTEDKLGHTAIDDKDCTTAIYCTACNYMTLAAKSHNMTVGASTNASEHILECSNAGCEYTDDEPHTFNKKVETTAYLKNNADCTTAKTYYYSCACGQKGSTTFTVGTELGHDFENGAYINADSELHWKKCSRCNVQDTEHKSVHRYKHYTSNNNTHRASCVCGKVDTKRCSGGTANCTEKAICSVCNTAYGNVDLNKHNYSSALVQGTSTHYYECSRCHGRKDEKAHEFNGYTSTGNNTHSATCLCEKTDTKSCSGGTATCTDKAVCSICNTAYGIINVNNHNYSSTLTKGDNTHYYECSRCNGKKSEEIHKYKNYTSNGDDTHTGTCVCEKTKDKGCSGGTATCTEKAKCSLCNKSYGNIDSDNHNYSSTLTKGENTHYYECSRCQAKKGEANHEYKSYTSNNNDTHTGTCICGKTKDGSCTGDDTSATCQTKASCEMCGGGYDKLAGHNYDTSKWGYKDVEGHAHSCKTAGCTAHDSIVKHTSSGTATEDVPETCASCGYVIKAATGHITHSPVKEWSSNAMHHWKECVGCSDQEIDKGAHIYDNACDTTCNTCNYIRQITHDYKLKNNDTQHWQECSVCHLGKANSRDIHSGGKATCIAKAECAYCHIAYGEKDSDNHTKSTYHYTTNKNSTHKKIYDCCNKVVNEKESCSGGSSTCQEKAVCQYCKESYGNVAAHNYDLTKWGYKRTDGHAHICKTSGCVAKDTIVKHVSSGAATEVNPEICTVCEYIIKPARSHTTHIPKNEWENDATHHWHECTGCSGQQLEEFEHIYDNDCDANCNTCGFERVVEHNCSLLKYDKAKHWYECVCGEKKDVEAHIYDDGGKCICGAEKKATPPDYTLSNDTTNSNSETEKTVNKDEEVLFPWWIIILVVIITSGAIGFIIHIKKKCKN